MLRAVREIRRFAYLCAKTFSVTIPRNWTDNELAGADWFASFIKRNTSLAIRTPEATRAKGQKFQ